MNEQAVLVIKYYNKPRATRIGRVCLWFVLFLLSFILLLPGKARAFGGSVPDNSQEVKVGYDVTGIYLVKETDGSYRGMNLEYLYEIAKYTNWHYTFVPYKSWAQAVEDLETGKLDILPTMLKSSEREKTLLFSDRSMGTIYVTVIVPKGNQTLPYGDIQALQGRRIGVRHNTVDSENFRIWAKDNKLSYIEIPYEGQGDLLLALDAGRIDAAAMSYVGRARAYRPIAEFAPQDMYFALPRTRRDLYVALNTALTKISLMNPVFYTNISKRYMGMGASVRLIFSDKERFYIKSAPPIRVTILRHALPFSEEEKDGTFSGALPELFARISQISGLKFEFVPVSSQEEALQAVKNQQADMVGRIADNIFFAEDNGLRLTTHYADGTLVKLHKYNKKNIRTIALQEPALQEILKLNKPKEEGVDLPVKYVVVPDFLDALEKGKVDAVYCDSALATYFLRTHRAADYELTLLSLDSCNMSLGISKRLDANLANVLDKCIRNIGCDKMGGIIAKHSSARNRSLLSMLEELSSGTLFTIIAILVLATLALAFLSFKFWRQRDVEKRLVEEKLKSQAFQTKMTATQEISAAKEDFFSLISHDMRTPLNGIMGFTDLAQASSSLPVVQEYLQKIKVSSNILMDLINDTLQLSKLERGKLPVTWETVDSLEFAHKTLTPVTVMAQQKQINLILNIDTLEHCLIKVDRLNTQNIFLNLLTNAVKFTPQGGSVIMTVTSRPVQDGKLLVQTIIQDTGIGMKPEFVAKAFEPFSQEQRIQDANQQGTGLGLAIVKKQVEKLGGTVQLSSKENFGTTVSVELPYEYVGPAIGKPVQESQVPAIDWQKLQGKKLLLCEDNAMNTEITVKLLEKKGLQVVGTTNGQEGVKAFAESLPGEYAAIIMDIRMPVMDGYAATQAIRKLARPDAKTIPILALSADAYEEDVAKCLAYGMNDYIAKPITPKALYATLVKYL